MNTYIRKIIRRRLFRITIVLCTTSVTAVLLPCSVYILSEILNNLAVMSTTALATGITIYVLVYLTANLLVELVDYCQRKTIQYIQSDLRRALVAKTMSGKYTQVKQIQHGVLLSYQKFCDETIHNLLFPFFQLTGIVTSVICSSLFIGFVNIWILVTIYVLCLFWLLATQILLKKGASAMGTVIEGRKKVNSYISQMLLAKEDIVAWNRHEDVVQQVVVRHNNLLKAILRKASWITLQEELDGVICVLSVGVGLLLAKLFGCTVTQGVSLYLYVSTLFSGIKELNSALQQRTSGNTYSAEIADILSVEDESSSTFATSLQNVTISEMTIILGDKVIMRDRDFFFAGGKATALWGPSGSGKTSLINALLGFIPFRGTITYGNESAQNNGICTLKSRISFVPQELQLFDDTLARNIHMDEEFDCFRMEQVLKQSGLEKDGFTVDIVRNTYVHENGANFSIGQRQRVCIARALYIDKPILILDEPTYALDNNCIDDIISLIVLLKGKKTILVATHDEKVRSACDCVVYLGKSDRHTPR